MTFDIVGLAQLFTMDTLSYHAFEYVFNTLMDDPLYCLMYMGAY